MLGFDEKIASLGMGRADGQILFRLHPLLVYITLAINFIKFNQHRKANKLSEINELVH